MDLLVQISIQLFLKSGVVGVVVELDDAMLANHGELIVASSLSFNRVRMYVVVVVRVVRRE
jgi:hypothetical protein